MEAQKRLPSREITLETKDGEFFFFKAYLYIRIGTLDVSFLVKQYGELA